MWSWEKPLWDRDMKRPGVGVSVDLALMAVQAGLGPGCPILT
jgi:hypothetical protein